MYLQIPWYVLLNVWLGADFSVKLNVQKLINTVAELSQLLMHLIVSVPSDLMFLLEVFFFFFFFLALTSFQYQRDRTDTLFRFF